VSETCGRCHHPTEAHYPARPHPLVNLRGPGGMAYITLRCRECPKERVCPMGSLQELRARFQEIREALPPPGMETEGEAEPVRALKAHVRHHAKPQEPQDASTDGKEVQTPARH
jgi:hypothetical protein